PTHTLSLHDALPIFPPVEQARTPGYNGQGTSAAPNIPDRPNGQPQTDRDQIPAWTRPNMMQRRAIRTRFWMSQNPRFVTNILISINVLVYLITALLSVTQAGGLQGFGNIDPGVLLNAGAQ